MRGRKFGSCVRRINAPPCETVSTPQKPSTAGSKQKPLEREFEGPFAGLSLLISGGSDRYSLVHFCVLQKILSAQPVILRLDPERLAEPE